jgi:tetratricopeptide (TPR) repeat protein
MSLHSCWYRNLLVLAAIVGPPLFSSAVCIPPPALQTKLRAGPTADVYREIGAWFGKTNQYSCAAEAYRSGLKLQPHSAKLAYLLGLSLYSAGATQDAIEPLEQSVKIAPKVLQPHLILAAALNRLQRNSEAESQWQAALKIDPHSPAALDGLSKCWLAEKKFADVVDLLRAARLNEDLTVDLGEAYLSLRMLDDAAKLLNDALAKTPSSMRLQILLARVSTQQFHYLDAAKIAANVAKQHPEDLEANRLYLQTLVLAGNTTAARPLAKKLLQEFPDDFDFLYLNGVLEHDAGDLAAARIHLQKAIQVNPNVAAAHFNFGLTLAQLNDPKGAKEQLEKALQLGSIEPEVHLQLGKALHTLGDNAGAQEQLKLYREGLQSQHDRALAASKAGQGDKILESDPHKAASFYRAALAATPNDAQLHYKLAVALDKAGDIAGERTTLEKAIQINPDLAVAQNQLGFLDSQAGDVSAAEQHFREAVRAAPDFIEAWVNLAATLGLESRFNDAKAAVDKALRLDPKNPQALLLQDTIAKALAQR